ncbi:MAG: hypothetical protein WDO13_15745 [Verrucomicrobiota bacterium]
MIGMSRPSHLEENLQALDVAFSAEELAELDRAFAPAQSSASATLSK